MTAPDPDLAPKTYRCAVIAMLVAFTAALVALAAVTPWTVDEPTYAVAGRLLRAELVWDTGTARLHGPLPFYANQLAAWLGASAVPEDAYRVPGRLGMLVFPVLGAAALTAFVRAMFDRTTALAALGLYATSPVILGHGCLMGTDMSLVPFYLLALFATWRFLTRPSWSRLPLIGVTIGAATATKYLGVFLVPVIGGALLVALLRGLRPALWRSRTEAAGRVARSVDAALAIAVVATIAWATLWACYGFAPSGYRPGTAPMSDLFQALIGLPGVEAVLGLFPDPWVRGLDYMKSFSEDGGEAWLLGRRAPGHVGYYAVALATKLPLAMLALLPFGLWMLRRWPRHAGILAGLGIAVPLAYLSLGQSLQIGLRHMLQVIPLLCAIAAVPLAAAWRDGAFGSRRFGAALVGAVLAGLVAFHAHAAPDYIGAFNALVGGRPDRVFQDSNLTWTSPTLGADRHRARLLARIGADAEQVFAASGPRTGRLIVHVQDLYQGVDADGRPTHWLHRFEPAATDGPWLAYALDRDRFAAHADAAAPGAPERLDAAIAWATAARFDPTRDAARIGGWLDGVGDPRRAAVAALLAGPAAGTASRAALWQAVGRHDLVLADDSAPPYLRAVAATCRQRPDRAVTILRAAAAAGGLPAAARLVLAGQLYNLQRPDEALEVLAAAAADPDADPATAALTERLRTDAEMLAAEQRRIEARIGHHGRLPTEGLIENR